MFDRKSRARIIKSINYTQKQSKSMINPALSVATTPVMEDITKYYYTFMLTDASTGTVEGDDYKQKLVSLEGQLLICKSAGLNPDVILHTFDIEELEISDELNELEGYEEDELVTYDIFLKVNYVKLVSGEIEDDFNWEIMWAEKNSGVENNPLIQKIASVDVKKIGEFNKIINVFNYIGQTTNKIPDKPCKFVFAGNVKYLDVDKIYWDGATFSWDRNKSVEIEPEEITIKSKLFTILYDFNLDTEITERSDIETIMLGYSNISDNLSIKVPAIYGCAIQFDEQWYITQVHSCRLHYKNSTWYDQW